MRPGCELPATSEMTPRSVLPPCSNNAVVTRLGGDLVQRIEIAAPSVEGTDDEPRKLLRLGVEVLA
jgi:hypothetical protein